MKIVRVEAIPFSIPLARASKWGASGYRTAQDHILVQVHSDEGLVGTAEATPRPTILGETQHSVKQIIDRHLAPMLTEADPWDRGYWWRMGEIKGNETAKGALDLAVHDLLARSVGQPLASLLGGRTDPLRISYLLGLGTVEEMREEVETVRATTGISAFKVKAGRDPRVDLERVVALRELLGPQGFISVDPNQQYTVETAADVLNAMHREAGVALAEEPVDRMSISGRRRVAERSLVPIVGDDSVIGPLDVQRELREGVIGVLGIKPPRSGVVGSSLAAHAATVFGLPCWIGSQGVSSTGTLATAHFAAGAGLRTFPADLGNFLKQQDGWDLLARPLEVSDGMLTIDRGPGTGADIDPEALERFRVEL